MMIANPRSETQDDISRNPTRTTPARTTTPTGTTSTTPTVTGTSTSTETSTPTGTTASRPDNRGLSYENLLVKQGKQIRALYEIQKQTFEKVTWIQKQIKKQNNDNNHKTDLSPKVFNVSKIISLIILLISF
jgi:hypothetical protein